MSFYYISFLIIGINVNFKRLSVFNLKKNMFYRTKILNFI